MRDATPRPLSLAELLLKFGIAAERGDIDTADAARRELRARFGVDLRVPRRAGRRVRAASAGRDLPGAATDSQAVRP